MRPAEHLAAFRVRQVEGDVTLVQVGAGEHATPLVPVVAHLGDSAGEAKAVRPAGRLNLDDVRAERAEVHRAVGAGPERAEIDDAQPGEWQ